MNMMKVVGVCGLLVVLCLGCATGGGGNDEKQIAKVIDTWKAAIETADIDSAMTCYAENYTDPEGRGKEESAEFLAEAKDQGYLEGIEVLTEDMIIEIDGEEAVAEPISLIGSFGGVELSYTLTKVDGAWLITSGEEYF
jgi:hypothetical protein